MDPVSMILAFALKNPQATTQSLSEMNRPGEVNVLQLQSSMIDFARQTLKCYHKTARFIDADVLGTPWKYHYKYGATNSVVMKVTFQGALTGGAYEMVVAAMSKEGAFRTAILQDTAMIPSNKNCAMEEWVSIQ